MKAMKDEDELPITCLNAEDTPAELLREVTQTWLADSQGDRASTNDYLYWRRVGGWRCLMGLGRAPEGALPWRELGMGHEEPVPAEDVLV